MKTFNMKKWWTVLSSRIEAKKVFDLAKKNSFNIIFDFSGVKIINSSFADELFWKLRELNIKGFKITNIENNFIKKIIIFVMEWRKSLKV